MTRRPSRATPSPRPTPSSRGAIIELDIASLAAGGDGVGRDHAGRVTFVPLAAPGDRVRVQLTRQTKSFARGEIVDVIARSASRVEPSCRHVAEGCGGCSWQQVARSEQLAAKQHIVASALRNIAGLTIHPIADPGPDLGWRRRARFHVRNGVVGLYAHGSHRVVAIESCPQLEPALDAALGAIIAARPSDGELAIARGHRGEIVVGVEAAWPAAVTLVGVAGIVGVSTGRRRGGDDTASESARGGGESARDYGTTQIEIEPGLFGGAWDFAQASANGNRALVACTLAAVGQGPGSLVELYAGAGNFTRGLVAAGWDVTASDIAAPSHPMTHFEAGRADEVLSRLTEHARTSDVVVLDPPRSGAAEAIAGISRLAPKRIVYVSCDPATLARDLARLDGYVARDAWPLDVMAHTSHVEVVVRLERL